METAGNYRETDQGTSFGNQSLDISILHIAVDFVGKQDVDTATQELVLVGTFEDVHITVRKPLAVSVDKEHGTVKPCTGPESTVLEDNDDRSWICAICMDHIPVEETAQVKGCEHLYCVHCILRWSTYKTSPWCPQCRTPFTMLYTYRSISGEMSDVMQAEPICLLLLAPWFKPLLPAEEEEDEYFPEEEEDSDEDTIYVRLGNRRWGENGYVRNGRMEARTRASSSAGAPGSARGASSATSNKGYVASSSGGGGASSAGDKPLGRRAKRAQERAAVDGGSRGGRGAGKLPQQAGRVGGKG